MSKLRGTLRHRLLLEIDRLKTAEQVVITKALTMAEEAHFKQYRPLTSGTETEPYMVIPMSAALILIDELGIKDVNSICTALLADALELSDGKLTSADLEQAFGRSIALMVSIISRPKADKNIPRQSQLATYHERITHTNIQTKLPKLAQRLAVMREAIEISDIEYLDSLLEETNKVYLPMAEDTDAYLFDELVTVATKIEGNIRRALMQ